MDEASFYDFTQILRSETIPIGIIKPGLELSIEWVLHFYIELVIYFNCWV